MFSEVADPTFLFQEMRPFAIKYNCILDIIDEVGAIAGCALGNLPETMQ